MDLSSIQLVDQNKSNVVVTNAATSGSTSIDLSQGDYFKFALSGNVTFSITNLKSTAFNSFVLDLTNVGTYSISWPTNTKWNGSFAYPVFSGGSAATIVFKSFDSDSWEATITHADGLASMAVPVTTPSISSPANGSTGISLNPALSSTAFSVSGLTHTASQWQVNTSTDFTSPLVDSGTDTTNKTSYTVATKLTINTVYYARVRHQGSNGVWSSWSSTVGFTTQLTEIYVDDVFSAYTYTGNGSTQTINNGIDLAVYGGLVWTKGRSAADSNTLWDTERGATYRLLSDATNGSQLIASGVTSFNSNGFTTNVYQSTSNVNYVSWVFRKATKFFDIVTYTGNGTAGRTIAHNLGIAPGMVIIKCTSTGGTDWLTYHRSVTDGYLHLNSTSAKLTAGAATFFGNGTAIVAPSSSSMTLGSGDAQLNQNGLTYVAYLFAHDVSADGIVQCGSYTGNYGAFTNVTLGWEPQYVLFKAIDGGGGDWRILDTSRVWSSNGDSGTDSTLSANTSNSESSAESLGEPTSTGFRIKCQNNNSTTGNYIYIAIRRPNKPPTVGTQVYNAIARTGTSNAATISNVGFAPDLLFHKWQSNAGSGETTVYDKLRGRNAFLNAMTTSSEYSYGTTTNDFVEFTNNGINLGTNQQTTLNANTQPEVNWLFKRAPGVFDVVCYTGTGSATTVAHSLGVAPELMIVKCRNVAYPWIVMTPTLGVGKYLTLNAVSTLYTLDQYAYNSLPTSTNFNVNTSGSTNNNGSSFVAYLFASKAGISKVGSYTGNGSSQDINCGFASTSRFIMIKRTDAADDWYVFDSARGIVASNDPHLSLNTTAAEVTTDDSIDAYGYGFTVNQNTATNINVLNGTYIYLSFA